MGLVGCGQESSRYFSHNISRHIVQQAATHADSPSSRGQPTVSCSRLQCPGQQACRKLYVADMWDVALTPRLRYLQSKPSAFATREAQMACLQTGGQRSLQLAVMSALMQREEKSHLEPANDYRCPFDCSTNQWDSAQPPRQANNQV